MPLRLQEIDLKKNYSTWREGSGPFRCFFRSTNFVSLKHYPDFTLNEPSEEKDSLWRNVEEYICNFSADNSIFMLDIPGTDALRCAYLAQKEKAVKAILTFSNPLHEHGLIGGQDYISALLGYGEMLSCKEAAGYLFVLDSNRFGDYDDAELRRRFNNQYELNDEDLPFPEMMRDLGYERIVCIFSGIMKEDVKCYLSSLENERFTVIRKEL
ncbi:MAG: hypothetical protein AB9903_17125 [Vulcanimicrobiota bacterium]